MPLIYVLSPPWSVWDCQDKTPAVAQRTISALPEADKSIMAEKAARKRLQMAAERVRLTANQPPGPHSVPTDELDLALMQPSCSRFHFDDALRACCVNVSRHPSKKCRTQTKRP